MRFSCGGSGDVGDDFEKKDQCDMSKRSSAGLTLDPICEEDEEPIIRSEFHSYVEYYLLVF